MEGIKTTVYSTLIISVLGFVVVFFGWDVAVDKYLTPQIKEKLKSEFYLREEIKKGSFVSTDKESFHKNHRISSEKLIELKDGKLATTQMLQDINKKVISLRDQLKKYKSDIIAPLNSKLTEISDNLEILKVKDIGRLELKIYFHKDPSDKGTLILNKSNPSISALIRNNDKYKIESSNNNKEKYQVRVQDLTIAGVTVKEAIASLYIDDHDELFDGSKSSGIGTAYLYIE